MTTWCMPRYLNVKKWGAGFLTRPANFILAGKKVAPTASCRINGTRLLFERFACSACLSSLQRYSEVLFLF